MLNRRLVWTASAAALFVLALIPQAGAVSSASRTTYLTFSKPVRLPGVALGSGTYIFELAAPMSAGSVVRVLSRDRKTAYFMGFTHAVPRPHGLPADAVVSLGESARDVAPPITVWWPTGENVGRSFIYAGR